MLVSSRFIMRQDLLPLFFQWDSRDPVSESLEAMMTGMTTELNTGLCGKPHMAQACGLGICVFIHSFNASLRTCVCMLSRFSHVRLFATSWTVALQAPLSVGFSRQEHWSGLPCPPPGDLPDPGAEAMYLMSLALAGGFFTTGGTWEALNACLLCLFLWFVMATQRQAKSLPSRLQ